MSQSKKLFAENQASRQGAAVNRWRFWRMAVISIALFGSAASAQERISLAGIWRFQMDRDEVGIRTKWFEGKLEKEIRLPGALQNEGFGDDISVNTDWVGAPNLDLWLTDPRYEKYRKPGNLKVPFGLQPLKHYSGVAWYQSDIEIPSRWKDKRVVLTLERAHWETRAWLDRQALGTNTSLSTPHIYELGTGVSAGRHTLTIRVDNRMIENVGAWANSVSDQSQGNWNGLIGKLELSAHDPVWIEDVQVHPNVTNKSARVKVRIGNATGKSGSGTLKIASVTVPARWTGKAGTVETEVLLGKSAATWDEFQPTMQNLEIELRTPSTTDRRTVKFGLREIATQGRQFTMNGRKIFLRGTTERCVFPLTGYPPTDVESWKRLLRICQAHGLNHVRFHSYCPPEAAFEAADELGVYLSVELPAWTAVGDGKSIDEWLASEGERIVTTYGNHPSFVLMTAGNEPTGKSNETWLAKWVSRWKAADTRRLYAGASGGPALAEDQYEVRPVAPEVADLAGRNLPIGTRSTGREAAPGSNVPLVVPELGPWCAYPDFDQMRKYTGPLKPKNLQIFRDSLEAQGMGSQWKEFLGASGKLQVLCYKEQIEAGLRTPGVAGFQLAGLQDFPGQGTALVGVLDPFWNPKGYVTPGEFRKFCNAVAPLVRMTKRIWLTNETFSAEIEVVNFGARSLDHAIAECTILSEDGKPVVAGEFPARSIPVGPRTKVGRMTADLARLPAPAAYRVVVALKGMPIENEWRIWVYPSKTVEPKDSKILISSKLEENALAQLLSGGKVLLQGPELGEAHPKLGFEPIVWNRYLNNTQERQTLGLLCDSKHPALAKFPTDTFQDWQWEDILSDARGYVLAGLKVQPIVQVIDDWNTNRKLGLIFECRIGHGKLLVCAANLSNDLEKRPAARQLRQSLLSYMSSPGFDPRASLKVWQFQDLLKAELR